MSLLTEEIKRLMPIMKLLNHLHIPAEKRGGNVFIHSIYKSEKTPSLSIRPDKDDYHCFATGQEGDVIQFYQDYYNLDTTEAIRQLADLTGLKLSDYGWGQGRSDSPVDPERKPVKASHPDEPLFKAFTSDLVKSLSTSELTVMKSRINDIMALDPDRPIALTDEIRHKVKEAEPIIRRELQLKRLETNKIIFSEMYYYSRLQDVNQSALLYLTEKRKLPKAVLDRFKIFSIGNYNEMNNHLKKSFSLLDLQKSGLYNSKDGQGNLIFFNHRIIIPYIYNGDIIYMRGRYFDMNMSPEAAELKYLGLRNDGLNLNSPKRFYNTDIWKTMLKNDRLYLTEGEFDAVAIESMGYNASAIPGAGCMPDIRQFMKLRDFDIIWCGDNDAAGRKLLTGHYTDQKGNKKYSQINVQKIFQAMGKTIKVKQLPDKDVNEFMVKNES